MRISGTVPSSVILSQTKQLQKFENEIPKVPKQAKAKRDGVINSQNNNFINLIKDNLDALETLQIHRSWP